MVTPGNAASMVAIYDMIISCGYGAFYTITPSHFSLYVSNKKDFKVGEDEADKYFFYPCDSLDYIRDTIRDMIDDWENLKRDEASEY